MKMQESAENYLETILILSIKNGSARSIDIAKELNFSKPSVSIAMKKLRSNGYININEDGIITLTESGLGIANKMYERHSLLSRYLIALGVDEAIALEDACRIEHVISQQSFEKIRNHVKAIEHNSL